MRIFAYLKGYLPTLPILWWSTIFVVVIVVGMVLQITGIKKKMTFRQFVALLATVAYVLLYFMSAVLAREAELEARYNLVFLWTYKSWIIDGLYFLPEIVGNIIMTIPLGMFLPSLFSGWFRRCDQQVYITVASGIVISIMIEVAQFLLHRGLADIDDVFNNTVGVLIGFLLQWLMLLVCNIYKKIIRGRVALYK